MVVRTLSVAALALALLGCASPQDDRPYVVTTLVLPQGHPEIGRTTFVDLGCASCHTVAWDAALPQPVSAHPGPMLDRSLRQLTPGLVATAIVVPSHTTAIGYRDPVDGSSPMGDYTECLTVRQLVDVVAYLRGNEPPPARSDLTPGAPL